MDRESNMISHHPEPWLEKVTWEEIRPAVLNINSELAKLIDDICPNKKHTFIVGNYKFGDLIIDDGKLQVLPKSTDKERKIIQEELQYSSIPLALLLNKQSEIFITEDERIIPFKVFNPGKLFGVFEILNLMLGKCTDSKWSISAGNRSIFALPKTSTNTGLKRLRQHFNLSADTLIHRLSDHWDVFRQISNAANFQEKWESKILFFSQEWLTSINNKKNKNNGWSNFRDYLFKQGWIESQQFFNREQLSINWRLITKIIAHRRLRPTSYISDTFKHLLLIPMGEAPVFQPTTSNLGAPIQGLKEAIVNVYLLDHYIPTIMHADLPSPGSKNYFYYSLSLPTLFEGTPASKNNSSTIMHDLKYIKTLVDMLQRDINTQDLILKNIEFKYFHVEEDSQKEIELSKNISTDDPRFLQTDAEEFPGRDFCATSQFWRGCIQIKV